MLFVDAGTNQVLINGSTGAGVLSINKTLHAQSIGLNIVDTESGNGTETLLNLTNNSDQDIQFKVSQVGATIKAAYIGPSTATQMNFATSIGSLNRDLYIDSASVVVNQDSRDYDFRVESNTESHALFVDGGNDRVAICKTGDAFNSDYGAIFFHYGEEYKVVDNAAALSINRINGDGNLIQFYTTPSAGGTATNQGNISVSGSTVTYGGGHLGRWSRLPDNSVNPNLLKGTVMTNLDAMVVWEGEENEQLNQMEISSVEGDPNVSGVFVSWDFEDDGYNDMTIAMTGDMIIRIAQGTTVQRGDLLMSAGDGTAKPQGDDIVRSKTIAKVTSTHVTCTYDDGSYCVPCVLMAC